MTLFTLLSTFAILACRKMRCKYNDNNIRARLFVPWRRVAVKPRANGDYVKIRARDADTERQRVMTQDSITEFAGKSTIPRNGNAEHLPTPPSV